MITPVGNQRTAELKDPRMDGRCGAMTGRPTFKLKHVQARGDACPGPAVPRQAAAD